MSTIEKERAATTSTAPAGDVIEVRRRTIDSILTGAGALLTVVFLVAGALLLWGSNFAADYVGDELESQQIFFPPEEALLEEGRDDLVQYAGEQVTTGQEAEAYASFIDGHLPEESYAQQGPAVTEAREALAAAQEAGEDQAVIDELQAEYDELNRTRETTFKGETLRGLLLSTYAWSTVGSIAGYAAYAAFAAAVVMAVLVVLGWMHRRKVAKQVA
jgi:hypothetical protein